MANFNVRSLPLIGPWVGKVGKVNDILAMPCGPSLDIWATAAWVNLPTLAWSFIAPDCLDAVLARGVARKGKTGGGERAGHRYRRRARLRSANIATLSEWAGGSSNEIEIPKGAVSTAMWRISQAAQRAGWYFLLMDASADFLVNWTSMAMVSAGCDAAGPLLAKAEVQTTWLQPPLGTFGPLGWDGIISPPAVSFGFTTTVQAGSQFGVGVGLKVKRWAAITSGPQPKVEARVIHDPTGFVLENLATVQPKPGEEASTASLTIIPEPPSGTQTFRVEVRVTENWADLTGSHMSLVGVPDMLDALRNSPCVPQE